MLFNILVTVVMILCIITLVMCINVLKNLSETTQNTEKEKTKGKLNIIKKKKTNKTMDELERVKTLFENIETFDGTSKGQKEIKNG